MWFLRLYQHFQYRRAHTNHLATSLLSFWKHSEKFSPINSNNNVRAHGNILSMVWYVYLQMVHVGLLAVGLLPCDFDGENIVREHLYQTKVPCEFCGESKPPIQIC